MRPTRSVTRRQIRRLVRLNLIRKAIVEIDGHNIHTNTRVFKGAAS